MPNNQYCFTMSSLVNKLDIFSKSCCYNICISFKTLLKKDANTEDYQDEFITVTYKITAT